MTHTYEENFRYDFPYAAGFDYGNFGYGSGASNLAFDAPLIHTLIYTGASAIVDSARASTAQIKDFESLQKTALINEPRFIGARRVHNILRHSENLLDATWTVVNVTKVDAQTITFNSAFAFLAQLVSIENGHQYRVSFDIQNIDGNNMVRVAMLNTVETPIDVSIDNTFRRYSVLFTATSTSTNNLQIQDTLPSGHGSIIFTNIQIEDVTGQSNKNPSDYVSSDVLSAPFHKAQIDAVKYFDTENGNTVDANNIVTPDTGSNISDTFLKGVLVEKQKTNFLIHSKDASQWLTNRLTVLTNDLTSTDGTVTANRLTPTTASGNHRLRLQNNSSGIGTQTLSADAWPAGYNIVVLRIHNGTDGQIARCVFDVLNGVIFSLIDGEATIEDNGVGGYRCSVTGVSTQLSNNAHIFVADNSGATNYVGDGVSAIHVDNMQMEAGAYATSRIITSGATVTREYDNVSLDSTDLNDSEGTIIIHFTPSHNTILTETIFLLSTYVDVDNYTAILHDGVNLIFRKRISTVNFDATIALNFVRNTTYKIGARYGSDGVDIWLDSAKGVGTSDTQNIQKSVSISVGSDGNLAFQADASFSNLQINTTALTDSEIESLTT